jgi:DNA polymerase III gamma/tau subunit
VSTQPSFAFPQPLSEKYQPTAINEFVGLEKPRKIMTKFAESPYPSAWLFVGNSGTGKTTMGLAICAAVKGELHHIPSQECTLDNVQRVFSLCRNYPRLEDWTPGKFHVVLVDEADAMSNAAQLAFLSKLDATGFPPNTIIIFTCNSVDRLEPRFLSRCRRIDFSSYGLAEGISGLLQRVWDRETDNPVDRPNFARIAKESNNNVRDALMTLEVAIMGA